MDEELNNKIIKVTILEDEESYRDIIRSIISQNDNIKIVEEHNNATSFLQSLKAPFKPDVCLIDIVLGEGNITGVDCIKALIEVSPSTHIIVMTAYPTADVLSLSKELGADLIVKGTLGEQLIPKIITGARPDEQLISVKCKKGIEEFFNLNAFIKGIEDSKENIDILTDTQRDILLMRQDGKKSGEIAEILGIKQSTVLTHMQRAREKLKMPDPLDYYKF